jgi:choline dehydrogenase-like flavoprotein
MANVSAIRLYRAYPCASRHLVFQGDSTTRTDSVLVIEYGYFDNITGMNPRRMFNITSQPCPALNNRTFNVGIGCVVGGSSSVNGQVFLRGTSEEYDAWKALGGPGSSWDWEGLLPYFRKGRFGSFHSLPSRD